MDDEVQLVPAKIHGLAHQGSASLLRNNGGGYSMSSIKNLLDRLPLYPVFGNYVPLTEDQIGKLEQRFGSLPEELSTLFRERGCAGFEGLATVKLGELQLPISIILGGGDSSYLVLNAIESIQDELDGFLPFAENEFGNLFLYGMREGRSGIWHWRHDFELDVGNPTFVCSSLVDLFTAIQIAPPM